MFPKKTMQLLSYLAELLTKVLFIINSLLDVETEFMHAPPIVLIEVYEQFILLKKNDELTQYISIKVSK